MNSQIIICFAILIFDIFMFMTEKLKPATTAMCTAVLLCVFHIITPQEAFSGFVNSSVLLFGCMFIISGALFKTGMAYKIAGLFIPYVHNERQMIFFVFITCGILSAFLPNLGTCAVMLPIVIGLADSSSYSRARLLMPMIYGATIGGTCTLIGTVGNTTIADILKASTGETIGFFEFGKIGLPMLLLGAALFYFFGEQIFPVRDSPKDYIADQTSHSPAPAWKQWLSLLTLACVVICVIVDIGYDLHVVAAIGALFLLVTGVINEEEAISSIQWKTLFLVAGMLPMSTALENTGAASLIAQTLIRICGNWSSPLFITAVIWIICNLLTQIMSNTATTLMMAPIGLMVAENLHIDPAGMLLAVLVGSSCAFMTPIGQGGNTMIFDIGGYTFSDYMRSGWQINLLCFIVSMICLAVFFL